MTDINISWDMVLHNGLSSNDKMVYGVIDACCRENGSCALNINEISDILSISRPTITKSISKLVSFGHVAVKSFDGHVRELVTVDGDR